MLAKLINKHHKLQLNCGKSFAACRTKRPLRKRCTIIVCLAHGDWQSFSKRSVFRSSWESLGLREAYELQLRILQIKNFESDLLIFSDNSHHNSSGNAATRSQCLCIWPRMRLLLTPAARTEQEVAPEKKTENRKIIVKLFRARHVRF